jgi:hypothetical protein
MAYSNLVPPRGDIKIEAATQRGDPGLPSIHVDGHRAESWVANPSVVVDDRDGSGVVIL